MTARGWPSALGALVLGVAVAACAAVPTSGSIRVSPPPGSGGSGQNGVQILPMPPGQAWSPQDIVKGFLAASASPSYRGASARPDYAIAREYLTKAYGKRWRPGWAATVVASPVVKRRKLPPRLVTGKPIGAAVRVVGQHLATLQTTGRYQAGSVAVEPASTPFGFSLAQVAGQWRIDGITENDKPKPTLLLIRRSDFERDYQPRNLYFYAPGADSQVLVPDPVYIPQQAGSKGIVAGLVGALLKRPPSLSWLFRAATTAFPPGTRELGSPQVIGGLAVVSLGGTAAKATPDQRRRMAAQLYWSLKAPSYLSQAANPITSVVLKLNGRPVQPLSQAAYMSYLPRGLGAPMYYQVPSGPGGPAVVMRTSDSQPVSVPLPKTLGGSMFGALAVSTAPVGSAVVAGCIGKAVYLMPQSRSGEVITTRLQSQCTSLSWDVHGNLWVATGSQIFEIPGAGIRPPASPTLLPVQVPNYSNGKFLALRVAPDGVRVALIVQTGSATKIEIAAISKYSDITYLAQERQMLRVGSDVAHPTTVSWLDRDHLLVLDRERGARTVLYQVPLDGATSTEVPIPSGVISVAAGRQGQQRVLVAIAPTSTTPGKIEMSTTELPNADWRLQVKGLTPVFPG